VEIGWDLWGLLPHLLLCKFTKPVPPFEAGLVGGVRGPKEGVGGGGMAQFVAGLPVPFWGSVSRRRPRMPLVTS
jgi:hypothetical protein